MKKKALTTIGWLISIALLASLFSKLDFHALWAGLSNAKWTYLLIAAAINILVIMMKTLRWQWMMQPETRTLFLDIFYATMIGLAGNNVLPARGGDWIKIYLIGRWERTSRAMLASVTGLDKLFDGLAILILFGALSLHSTFPEWVQKGTLIVSITISVSLIICILLLLHHRRTPSDSADELSRFSRLAKNLGSGFGALANRRLAISTLIISIGICLTQVLTIWLCQLAFGQHLDIWIPALVFVAINLAIIIPSAPSGVGPFEVAAVLAYSWLGIKAETGFNIALMYHAMQFFPVTIFGAIIYARTSGVDKKIKLQDIPLGEVTESQVPIEP